MVASCKRGNVKTEQRANGTNTGEIGELVYKRCWNTLRAGETMRWNRNRVASKRIRGGGSQAETKYERKKSADRPRVAKEQKQGELCTDRNFLHNAVHTVGGHSGKRKGDFLDGGCNILKFFVGLRSRLGNLASVANAILLGRWNAAPLFRSEGRGSLEDLSSSKTIWTGGFR